jgi:hypothetical protein
MNFGLIKSNLVGDERHFYKSQPVGNQFTHSVGEVINQGEDPICAACAVCTFLNWRFPDRYWNPWALFKSAGGTRDGISFKEILSYLRKKGIIQEYALIHSEQALRTAIRVNGPCLGALNVYNSNNCDFWDGKRLEGGHGISLIGWHNDDFVIRNSWGDKWCKGGNTSLPGNRFNLLQEMWTIIA